MPPPPHLTQPVAVPGFHRLGHRRIFRRQFRVAWHGIETPHLFAGLGIVSRHVTAHAEFSAAVADQHLAFDDARGARDRIALGTIDDRVDAPDRLTTGRIEGNQASVKTAHVDLALPDRHAPVYRPAAALAEVFGRHLRVVFPEQLAGSGIDRIDNAEGPGGVHHPIDHQRRGFGAAVDIQFRRPGHAQLADVARIDAVPTGCSAARRRCGRGSSSCPAPGQRR